MRAKAAWGGVGWGGVEGRWVWDNGTLVYFSVVGRCATISSRMRLCHTFRETFRSRQANTNEFCTVCASTA